MARFLLKVNDSIERIEEDGGLGSGNWGHHGRPGLRGGSGKGGGNQYRGGRSDIMYTGSKHDWMNGLQGERQKEAQQFIKNMGDLFGAKEQGKTVERCIMEGDGAKAGPMAYKQKLIDFMSEARNWNKHSERLVGGNLDESEQKLLETLAQKYGVDYKNGNSNVPDENGIEQWDNADRDYYYDLKSKAMGGPTSGKEPPEELMYEAGLKERPKKIAVLPHTKEENEKWIEGADEINREWATEVLINNGLKPHNDFGEIDMNEAETRFESQIVMALAQSDTSKLEAYSDYLYAKAAALRDNITEDIMMGYAANLTPEESKTAQQMLKLGYIANPGADKYDEEYEAAEVGLLNSASIPPAVKAYYLGLKAKALGLDNSRFGEMFLQKCYGYSFDGKYEELKEKCGQTGQYLNKKEKNAVVIAGDAFSEKINSMRKSTGTYSLDELSAVGDTVAKEVEPALAKAVERVDEARKRADDALSAYRAESRRKDGEQWSDYIKRTSDLYDKYKVARDEANAIELSASEAVTDALSRIRKTGINDAQAMKNHMPGKSQVKKYIEKAYGDYPTEWIEASFEKGSIQTRKVGRGYCGEDIIAISGDGEEAARTATHELGHRFERTVPGIVKAESEFYKKRTANEPLVSLKSCTGMNYRSGEKTRKDSFLNPYMGKDYGGGAYELVSMGFEMAFHRPTELMKDRDYANFIFGLLAVG